MADARFQGRDRLQGGLIWGSKPPNGKNVYYSISDWDPMHPEEGGGVVALEIATGKIVWQTPAVKPACLATKGCSAGQPGAVALIPGAVFATSLDGHLRAYRHREWKDRLGFRYAAGVPESVATA